MLKDRLTLLIHSCDKFSDLWPTHIHLLNQNWADRDCRTIILTDRQNLQQLERVEIKAAGDGQEITGRIKYVLDHICTDYILVTLDDYFPTTKIDSERIKRLIDIMDKEGYDYIRLFNQPKTGQNKTKYKNLYDLQLNGDYQVNLYVGIWRKDFMAKTLGCRTLNAWEFEVTLTENARRVGGKCAVSLGREFPILDVVRKGRILPKASRYLKKHDLYHGSRPIMPRSAYIKLGIKEMGSRVLSYLPKSVYQTIKVLCVKMGMKSFSAQ
ncbi:hypothetical protein [Bacteroides caecimuris]|uniref:hypothetical protein n=1 Tax=Bacteroides caecimuris TaxID=1796613 RepID=UPI002649D039|nr:hypothetical protein [Bacteroides caecimuris]